MKNKVITNKIRKLNTKPQSLKEFQEEHIWGEITQEQLNENSTQSRL